MARRAGRRRKAQGHLASAFRAGRTATFLFVGLSLFWVAWHRFAPVNGTVLMGMRSLQGETVAHAWTPLNDVSPEIVRAVIAAEDNKFCDHLGFDLGEMRAAWREARSGGRVRGASTISQQTAKNVFLWPGGGYLRKGFEVWFTGAAELFWPKRRVMEVYLNVAEWGDGYFGIEAAARGRFGKSAKDLTSAEAALLAAVLPSPNKWRVDPPGPYVASRARTLRSRMAQVRREGRADCVLGD